MDSERRQVVEIHVCITESGHLPHELRSDAVNAARYEAFEVQLREAGGAHLADELWSGTVNLCAYEVIGIEIFESDRAELANELRIHAEDPEGHVFVERDVEA